MKHNLKAEGQGNTIVIIGSIGLWGVSQIEVDKVMRGMLKSK